MKANNNFLVELGFKFPICCRHSMFIHNFLNIHCRMDPEQILGPIFDSFEDDLKINYGK